MKIIISLDEDNGYMFNNRRQTFDISIAKDIKELVKNSDIFVSEYTYKKYITLNQLNLSLKKINNLKDINNEWYILEDIEIRGYIDNISKIVVYFLNTIYPSDKKFTIYLQCNFKCIEEKKIKSDLYDNLIRKTYIKT